MEILKNSVFSVALVLIASGVIMLLTPDGKLLKQMRFLCSAVVLSVILNCFSAGADIDFSSFKAKTELPDEVAQISGYGYTEAAESALRQLIEKELANLKISGAEITIIADNAADGGISFSSVIVILQKSDSAKVDTVYQALSKNIGKDISVRAKEE